MKKWKDSFELLADVFEIPICFFHKNEEIYFEFKEDLLHNPLNFFRKSAYDQQTELLKNFSPYPRVRKSKFFERYILMSIFEADEFLGTLVVGPSIPKQLSQNQLLVLLKDWQAFSLREQVMNYYEKLPIYSTHKLIKISKLLFQLLNNQSIEEKIIKEDYYASLKNESGEQIETQKVVMKPISSHTTHDQLFENQILKIVRHGDIELLKKRYFVKDGEDVSMYSKSSSLRSLKNHLITLAALVSRAAIEGGVHSETALEYSDQYILNIEEAFSEAELYRLTSEMLNFFTFKVREVKNEQYSSVVVQAIYFISTHLYINFQNNEIAEYVAVSPNYLSYLFNKETGSTLTTFIQRARIEEAKHLLQNTNISIHEVGDLLSFSDQSYFTKIFKKHVGVTPKQFKNK